MNAGKELDALIASEVMGLAVEDRHGEYFEEGPKGLVPIRPYTTEMGAAWDVVEKLGIALIPIDSGGYFALVGRGVGWSSPADFLRYLQEADFANAGAAVSESAPMAICMAAVKSVQNRRQLVERAAEREGIDFIRH